MTDASSDTFVTVSKTPTKVDRIDELRGFFRTEFNVLPDFFVRVPGRVNLIGEHIDYSNYPVLPMAIKQNILMAVATSDDGVLQLKNFQDAYKPFKCSLNEFKIEVPETGGPQWYNYFLCGLKGAMEYHVDYYPGDHNFKGMMVAVSGNIPPASGLSSSSALVCAAVLATFYANKMVLNQLKMATIAAECEHYIGTQGGGMDQAIAFLAKSGCAQFIEWSPLIATPVNLPPESLFVIANSLIVANKAATSDFNKRVVENHLGCRLITKILKKSWRYIDRFATLQKALGCSIEEMIAHVEEYLPKDIYTKEELVELFGVTEDYFDKQFITPNTKNCKTFKLRKRALHVLQEVKRVKQFRMAAENNDMKLMSTLMRQSHASLCELYECSHSNLDQLVELADSMNIGARLTGAGWGGCIVALCDSIDSCDAFIQLLKESYYKYLPQTKGRNPDDYIFVTNPQQGAEIYIDDY